MPDCAISLSCGDATATVTRTSAQSRGENEVDGESPSELFRVLALVADFSSIRRGDIASVKTAELGSDDSTHLVTSAKTDVSRTSLVIGLSSPLSRTSATISGKRRAASAARSFKFPLDILYVENGTPDNFTNAVAPTYAYGFTIAIARDAWPDTTTPEIADTILFSLRDTPTTVKVSAVTRHDGWYILNCRTKD